MAGLREQGAALPDLDGRLAKRIGERNLVVSHWTVRGTHRGEMLRRAPTGKTVTIAGFTMNRVAEGKIAEE